MNRNSSQSYALRDQAYFEAGHSVTLNDDVDGSETKTIRTADELFELIAYQRRKILGDEETVTAWAKVDKAFSTKDDQELRTLLSQESEIRLRLADPPSLRREMMLAAIKEHGDEGETDHDGPM